MKSFLIIGLGRFGAAVAKELCSQGHEVLAIDHLEQNVQAVADQVTHAVTGDARDPIVLKALGVRNYDCAIVAMGDDIASSVLITLALKEAGVPEVICKASSHVHRKVLEKIGADRVVFPEHEMGVKLAQGLSHSNILNFIELSEHYEIVEISLPKAWQDKTLKELNIRAQYGVTIIAIRRGSNEEIEVGPGGDFVLHTGDNIMVLGRDDNLEKLHKL